MCSYSIQLTSKLSMCMCMCILMSIQNVINAVDTLTRLSVVYVVRNTVTIFSYCVFVLFFLIFLLFDKYVPLNSKLIEVVSIIILGESRLYLLRSVDVWNAHDSLLSKIKE